MNREDTDIRDDDLSFGNDQGDTQTGDTDTRKEEEGFIEETE